MNKRIKNLGRLLILVTFLTYLGTTVSKNLYTAEKLTMMNDGIGGFEELARSMQLYSITYSLGQILLFFFIKKLDLKKFLLVTVGLSAVLIGVMFFSGELMQHYLIFLVNGLLQSGLWGGALKLLSVHLPAKMLPGAVTVMT